MGRVSSQSFSPGSQSRAEPVGEVSRESGAGARVWGRRRQNGVPSSPEEEATGWTKSLGLGGGLVLPHGAQWVYVPWAQGLSAPEP